MGVFPPPPEGTDLGAIEIQYVSVLSDAQRASSTATTERFLQFTGQVGGIYPEVLQVPNVEEMIRRYANNLGLQPADMRSREEVQALREQEQQAQQVTQAAETGATIAQGAKNLSDAEVGGGMNALQLLTQ